MVGSFVLGGWARICQRLFARSRVIVCILERFSVWEQDTVMLCAITGGCRLRSVMLDIRYTSTVHYNNHNLRQI